MKFLIFNITVAASLVYLVAGEELGLTSAKDAVVENAAPQIDEVKETVASLTADDIRPMVADMIAANQATSSTPLSEDDIKAIVINAVADAMAAQQIQTQQQIASASSVITESSISHEIAEEGAPFVSQVATPAEAVPEIQEVKETAETSSDILEDEELPLTVVDTPQTHAPSIETGGLGTPELTDMAETETPVQIADASDNIQLADGESMMAPKTRQKELDKLVNSLELMFLDLAQ